MKALFAAIVVGLGITISIGKADEAMRSDTFALRYIRATEAFQLLKEENGEFANAVESISARKNTISLNATDPNLSEIRRFLVEIDQRPKLIKYTVAISEITPKKESQRERIVARPTVTTLQNRPMIITHRLENGKVLKISVLATEPYLPVEPNKNPGEQDGAR